ncbi:thrombospondin-related anonymous protein-like [Montipora foliosa]|uniref:thrombospondin-related anonymous protein-like n=1 Tax=Montipora foliosa TaxID=591990 RepID=UPI0035F1FD27
MMKRFLFLVVLFLDAKANYICSKSLDILFAVDVSGSIDGTQFDQTQQFLSDLVEKFTIQSHAARIGVFAFDHLPHFSKVSNLDHPGTVSLAGVKEQIANLTFTQGATLINVGLVEAGNVFNHSSVRDNVSRVVVFLTDGVNYRGSESLVQHANDLRTIFNARIISLGIGAENIVDEEALNVLVGPGKPHQIILLDFKKKSCSNDDEDGSDEEGEGPDDESGSSDEESCVTKLDQAASLICA